MDSRDFGIGPYDFNGVLQLKKSETFLIFFIIVHVMSSNLHVYSSKEEGIKDHE